MFLDLLHTFVLWDGIDFYDYMYVSDIEKLEGSELVWAQRHTQIPIHVIVHTPQSQKALWSLAMAFKRITKATLFTVVKYPSERFCSFRLPQLLYYE